MKLPTRPYKGRVLRAMKVRALGRALRDLDRRRNAAIERWRAEALASIEAVAVVADADRLARELVPSAGARGVCRCCFEAPTLRRGFEMSWRRTDCACGNSLGGPPLRTAP